MPCSKLLPASRAPPYGTVTVTFYREASIMSAAALAFRFRVFIFVLLYVLGFLPPWDYSSAGRSTLWLAASTLLARSGWISLASATLAVTFAALACLVAGASLRLWGTAYLGSGVMRDSALQGEGLVAAGPYRHLRNPLYLGSWLLALGTSILMPGDGAGFFLIAYSIFVFFLITTEERFLSAKLGNAYQEYVRLVPRWLPRITASTGASEARPHWLQAVLAETYPIAFTLCFAALAWRYNARVLMQCLLICYGASLVARALIKRPAEEPVSKGTEL
jgi:protein-S-isoprenylcysteine O-methyltransferase Ste14